MPDNLFQTKLLHNLKCFMVIIALKTSLKRVRRFISDREVLLNPLQRHFTEVQKALFRKEQKTLA